jgi:hypothetical protein
MTQRMEAFRPMYAAGAAVMGEKDVLKFLMSE